MPNDASGNHTLPAIYKAVPGTTILDVQHNTPLEDLSQALSEKVHRDGRTPFTAPQGGVPGVDPSHFITKSQYDAGAPYLSKRKTLSGLGVAEGSAADRGPAINAALATLSPGDFVDLERKTYRADTQFQVPSGIIMERGSFDISNAAANVRVMRLGGALGAGVAVSTALSKGVGAVTLASTAGLARGSRVLFRQDCGFVGTVASISAGVSVTFTVANSAKFTPGQACSTKGILASVSSTPSGATMVMATTQTAAFIVAESVVITNQNGFAIDQAANGWWGVVRDVLNGTQISLEKFYPHAFTMTASDLVAYVPTRRSGNRFSEISAFRNGLPINDTYFFQAEFADDVTWEGGRISNVQYAAREWYDCTNFRVRETQVDYCSQDGAGYADGIVQTSEDFWIEKNVRTDCRHGTSIGGTGGICSSGWIRDNKSHGSQQAGEDVHPNAHNIRIIDNVIEIANRHRSAARNNEGIVYQGAHGVISGNTIKGLGSLTSGVGGRDCSGVLVQPFTRMPEDRMRVSGNEVRDVIGAGIIAIQVQNAKPAGGLEGVSVVDNDIVMTDFGGNGATSPIGVLVESGFGGTTTRRLNISGNTMQCRSSCITVTTLAGKGVFDTNIVGNTMQTINTDAPVIDVLDGGAANLVEGVTVTGNTTLGGSHGYRRATLVTRDTVTGNTIRGAAISAINGTPTTSGNNTTV